MRLKIVKNKQGKKRVSGFYFLGGDFYKLLWLLLFLASTGFMIWLGMRVFSQTLLESRVISSVIFMAGLGLWITIWIRMRGNRWRSPSYKLMLFSLICITVIFAFAGVQPMVT